MFILRFPLKIVLAVIGLVLSILVGFGHFAVYNALVMLVFGIISFVFSAFVVISLVSWMGWWPPIALSFVAWFFSPFGVIKLLAWSLGHLDNFKCRMRDFRVNL